MALQIGRYVLHDEIAAGGMAAVHFGRLVGTGGFAKTVAIKRLHRHLVRQASFRNMILEEARLASRIRHPNVVPPLDVLGEGSELLLVMEYVHGESLSRLLKAAKAANEKTPVAVVAAIFANVLHGLHAAHEARDEGGQPLDIVHRDVSPQNVLVGVDGIARVIDFGIAKAVDTGETTTAGTIKGKMPYLSPEQLDGEQATRRTDIYAASVCMWEALAGKRLMDGTDDTEVLRQIVLMAVPAPSTLNGAVPASIDDVVLKGLARDPMDRFPTAREMALAIEAAVHLGTATQVGAWAERLAAPALAARAAKLAMVESALQDDEGDDDEAPTEMLARPSPLAREPAPAPPLPAPLPPPVPAPLPPPPPPHPATKRPPPPSFVPPTVVIAPPPESVPIPQGLAPPANTPTRPPPAGALRKPELEIPNVAWLPPAPSFPPEVQGASGQGGSGQGGSGQGGSGPGPSRALSWFLAFLVLVLLVGWLAAPFAVGALVVSAAAKEGVTLTVDRVDISRRAVRLVDVRAEAADLPGVTVHAGSVTITTRLLRPHALVFDDVEVTADGAWPDVLDKVAKWRAARAPSFRSMFAGYTQISVASGRLDWKNIASPGTSLALENVAVDMSKNGARAFGDDWRVSAPLVMFRSGAVAAGPFGLDAERQGTVDRVILRLDPSGIYAASVTWSAADDGSEAVAFSVPPTRLADLHVPPAMLAGLGSDRSRVEARGELSIIAAGGKRSLGGKLTLAAGDLGVFPGESRVDLSLDVPVTGDPSSPIAIHGATLSVAAADPSGAPSTPVATAKLEGGLVLARGARLQLAGTTTPIPCAPNHPTGKNTTTLVTVIDFPLQALLASKLSMTPTNSCAPRLK